MTTPFLASVGNCFLTGIERSRGISGWPDQIDLRLGRYRVTINQLQHACGWPSQEQKGCFVETTKVVIHNLPTDQPKRGERIARDLATLLSFASMSQVRAFSFQMGDRSWAHAVVGQTLLFRPTIEMTDGVAVRGFLESTWADFRRLKSVRQLPALIEYVVASEVPGQPLEAKLLQAFVALENIKATWARSERIPYIDGRFRRKHTKPGNKGEAIGIEELLTGALAAVGIKRGIKRLVRLRNEIVHWGMSNRPVQVLFLSYEEYHDLIREYLLRLLGFSGQYHPYSNPNGSRMIEPKTEDRKASHNVGSKDFKPRQRGPRPLNSSR